MKEKLRVERFIGGISLAEVDVIFSIDEKKLIKTWNGYKQLEFIKDRGYWMVTEEWKEIPKEWQEKVNV